MWSASVQGVLRSMAMEVLGLALPAASSAAMMICPVSRYLEEAGQLAVPVGDVSCAVFDQGRDDLAQGSEGEVDGGSFLEPAPPSARE